MTSETGNSADPAHHASPHDKGKERKKENFFARTDKPQGIRIGVGILVVIALALAGYWFFFMRGIVYSDDARFNGHMVDVAPTVSGRVITLLVKEGCPGCGQGEA